MRLRDARAAARFGKTRCWKDHKCWVVRCTLPPRRQRNSRRYIVFYDPQARERTWLYACEEHSRGLRRIGKAYRAALKRISQRAARVLARYGTDEEIDAYLAQLRAERRACEQAGSNAVSTINRILDATGVALARTDQETGVQRSAQAAIADGDGGDDGA